MAPEGGQPGAGRGATLSVILRESSTRLGFLARLRMVPATASPRPLMRPMAKCRSRVMFSGPWPERAAPVLVEAPVEDVVGGLDGPVPAIEGEQAFLGGGLRGQAGDAVGDLAAPLAGLDLDGFATHGEDLSDAGEVEVVG